MFKVMIKCKIILEYIESKTFVLKGYRIKINWDENLKKKCLESFYPISKNIYYNLLPKNNN
jgi:hypothetical protein